MGANRSMNSDETDDTKKRTVLILCTGNSCRSQMAELIWNELGHDRWNAYSAGSRPAGFVHPLAVEVLEEIGLSARELVSKPVEPFHDRSLDLVITVCDNARESCPLLAGAEETLHWPFEDPADSAGTDDQKLKTFRRVRDEIKQKISVYLQPPLQQPRD